MKVLWVCKGPIPKASKAFGLEISSKEGWLIHLAEKIESVTEIEFSIAFFDKSLSQKEKSLVVGNTTFWGINNIGDYNSIEYIIRTINPDIIHIWGTENSVALSVTEVCKSIGIENKIVISIQGLVSIYAQHYMGHLPWNVQLIPSLRDIIRNDTLWMQYKEFYKKGELEKKAIQNVNHVIGRTTWDYACVKQVNPDVSYHFNNETLRPIFYKNQWDIKKCIPYSIFVSQAQFPIKGFHYMLEAMSLIIRQYPNAKLYVSGSDNSFKGTIKQTAYGKYLKRLIKLYNLSEHVKYIGMLQEEEMCKRFLKSHVFVSPSIIENSPNSVGEAMLLGMPVVASNVGGVADLIESGKEGYIYQSDAPYMLAHYVCRIFENSELAHLLGSKARIRAEITHDINTNLKSLIEIYKQIEKGE